MQNTLSNALSSPKKKPTLFGLTGKTNRETGQKTYWGKNEFNSSFPTSLLCYMFSKGIKPVYLKLDTDLEVEHSSIDVSDLFRKSPRSNSIYYSFEDSFTPYQEFVHGQLERNDLIIRDTSKASTPIAGFEIKLTVLPDSSTVKLTPDKYSCELVFRRPSILHLALSVASFFKAKRKELLRILKPSCAKIYSWRHAEDVVKLTDEIISALDEAFLKIGQMQEPLIIQPIWKTEGQKCLLDDNCLDVFVWSNLAFSRLFIDDYKADTESEEDPGERPPKKSKVFNLNITRPQRCIFWLARMLYDFAQGNPINDALTVSEMAYQLQTDKAFSINGSRSWKYLSDDILLRPRIKKKDIRNIILNGGQNELSPERRFDLALVRTPGIFK